MHQKLVLKPIKMRPTNNGEPIAVVNDFKYLGSYMSSSEKDINDRIALAWFAFHTYTLSTSRSKQKHIAEEHHVRRI